MRSRPPRVLLLESEEALREILRDALGDLGFEVLTARGRKQALALLMEHPDMELAVVDLIDVPSGGEAVAAFLGELPASASIPLVVMTDGDRPTAAYRAVPLAKPFGLEELTSAIRSARAKDASGRRDADAHDGAR